MKDFYNSCCFKLFLLFFASYSQTLNADYLKQLDYKDRIIKLVPKPAQSNNYDMIRDVIAYKNALKLRKTDRGKKAILDTDFSINGLLRNFSTAYGILLSNKTSPKLYKLLVNVYNDNESLMKHVSNHYKRQGPFLVYKQNTCNPKVEEEIKHNGSYPSDYTVFGITVGLILTELNPNKAPEIMRAAYEYGQSRVICGFNWQSDVDVGKTIGATLYSVLHSNKQFGIDLNDAKRELSRSKIHYKQ